MAQGTLNNVQGDLFSRGFPKYNESYYFFSIASEKERDFCKALKTLVSDKDKHISSLAKVLADWAQIDGVTKKNREDPSHRQIIPTSNALIAFTKGGLNKIQAGLPDRSLDLNNLKLSDPAFDMGMPIDGPKNLNDPLRSEWDPLFRHRIHGLLKVAGSCPSMVEKKLDDIKSVLGHPTVIKDIAGHSPPTSVDSRVDRQIRTYESKMNGHEHFGFRDGISQPLLRGINSDHAFEHDKYMKTDQKIIIISGNPPGTQDGIKADPKRRPPWMIDGSFLAFRKLEQNVQGWIDLVNKFESAGCGSAEQCGAKLMGRWKSGDPITLYPENPPEYHDQSVSGCKYRPTNDFRYKGVNKFVCPLGAHIRKVNPRTDADSVKMARLIRNGIPYGTEFLDYPDDKRGLLFACYQSSLENSFRFVQQSWCNVATFPLSRTGYDPFIGQTSDDGLLHTTPHDANDEGLDPGLGTFAKMVTMKGGDYFFVPSIKALRDTLGSD
ncbi:MAG: hypothetical protein Q9195_007217 [Heterodermia aff. obscurata]